LARAAFDTVKARWSKPYLKEMKAWEEQLPTLLTFYNLQPDEQSEQYGCG
jgi:transposase-like protein